MSLFSRSTEKHIIIRLDSDENAPNSRSSEPSKAILGTGDTSVTSSAGKVAVTLAVAGILVACQMYVNLNPYTYLYACVDRSLHCLFCIFNPSFVSSPPSF